MTTPEMLEESKKLKAKYRNSNRPKIGGFALKHRTAIDPPEGTLVCTIGLSSKRGRTGGNSGTKSNRITVKPHQRTYGPPWTR